MAINQKDIKLLWGRSGNRCAYCRVELIQDKKAITAAFTLGEQAHIVGEEENAARGKSTLSLDERNNYHNLILLCPNHHTEIDKNEDDWPIEKLHQMKSQHELWVTETLSDKSDQFKIAKQVIVASLIDSAVALCRLENWQGWTSFALSTDPTWPRELPDNIFSFREKVIAAIWPDEYGELKRATVTFSILLNRAAQTFMEHSELHGDTYYPYKFYKANGWNDNYQKDLEEYTEWVKTARDQLKEATKAANWFADVVRKDINPMFFAEPGKFLIMQGDIFGFVTSLLEFSKEEKDSYPDSFKA